jgi:4-hydroxy-2-oxoheptanedioate aldolase
VELMTMAADAAGIAAIARPRSRDAGEIQAALDRGVAGVQIPHVASAADARAAVAAVRFGPDSTRGLALGTRASGWQAGGSLADFAAAANERTLICVQLEDAEAIARADEILAVAGIDVFFIGPSDLSQSLGFPGLLDAPPVAEAIESTLQKIGQASRIAGMPSSTGTVAARLARGVRYTYTHLPAVLTDGAAAYLRAAGRR